LDKFVINGPCSLKGEVNISGAKNAAVAVLPAALIINGISRIENVPDIMDVKVLLDILSKLGAKITKEDDNTVICDTREIDCWKAPYELVKSMRASYYLLGALIARFGRAEVSLPGGCDFGFRPIDQHIKGFEAMGAKVEIEHGIVKIDASDLRGAQIYLDVVSVGATINLMLAAVKANGQTIIENAAKEPHVVDVANFLNAMGASIRGAGTDVIKIKGVDHLKGGGTHSIIPDMIEAGTFMIAAAATRGDVVVRNIIPKHMESLTAKLIEMGVSVIQDEDFIRIVGQEKVKNVNIMTLPYPGFPTDLQPQITVLLNLAEGVSTITEGVWDSRFQYVDELKRMGAKIKVEGRIAVIDGATVLSGAPVKATDLRAGAAMVLAGLISRGRTEVTNIKYIDRGYENFVNKLNLLGADISRISAGE
jgi:UDP-N-acetylglucosamine 1-carboxyvinyltransferase